MFDYFPNAHPHIQVRKDFNNAATICEWCFLQDREVFHHPVVNDVLHDLINEIDLTAIKIHVIQICRECFLRRIQFRRQIQKIADLRRRDDAAVAEAGQQIELAGVDLCRPRDFGDDDDLVLFVFNNYVTAKLQ